MKISILFLPLALTAAAPLQDLRTGPIRTCASISLARPGFGTSYRGTVRNDDYKLSLAIPEGLTGWGADPVAPFHSFTIFLSQDGDQSSCIVFEIHLRVDRDERADGLRGARIRLGNFVGRQEESAGTINGAEVTNVRIRFSVSRAQEVDDGDVWLVTPTKDLEKSRAIFDRFLSQVRVERKAR